METTLHRRDTQGGGVMHPNAVQESYVLRGHAERGGEAAEEHHHNHLHTEGGFSKFATIQTHFKGHVRCRVAKKLCTRAKTHLKTSINNVTSV